MPALTNKQRKGTALPVMFKCSLLEKIHSLPSFYTTTPPMKTSATPGSGSYNLKLERVEKSAWILISPLDIIGDVEMISVRTLIVLSVISAAFPGVWAEAK